MSMQTPIRDRARGLRGPGLTTADRDDLKAFRDAAKNSAEVAEAAALTVEDVRDALIQGYEYEAIRLFQRFAVQPSAARKKAISTLIKRLKESGAWYAMDAFYVLWAEDEQSARLNWIENRYNLTAANSPTFTANNGYSFNGTTQYLDTGFNPATAVGSKYTLNNAHQGADHGSDLNGGTGLSSFDAGNTNARFNNGSTAATQFRPNNVTTMTISDSYDVPKVWTRDSSSSWTYYNNGALALAGANASTAHTSFNFCLGRISATSYGVNLIRAFHFGSALTAAQVKSISDALHEFKLATLSSAIIAPVAGPGASDPLFGAGDAPVLSYPGYQFPIYTTDANFRPAYGNMALGTPVIPALTILPGGKRIRSNYGKSFAGVRETGESYGAATRFGVSDDGIDWDYGAFFVPNDTTAPVTFTLGSPGVVNWPAHGLVKGAPIRFSTTGALPTGLNAGQIYYVLSAGNPDTLILSDRYDYDPVDHPAPPLNFTGAQSGVHTAIATGEFCADGMQALLPDGRMLFVQSHIVGTVNHAIGRVLINPKARQGNWKWGPWCHLGFGFPSRPTFIDNGELVGTLAVKLTGSAPYDGQQGCVFGFYRITADNKVSFTQRSTVPPPADSSRNSFTEAVISQDAANTYTLIFRTSTNHMYVRTTDQGATWSAPAEFTALPTISAKTYLRRLPNRRLIHIGNPAVNRNTMVINISDVGASPLDAWPHSFTIDARRWVSYPTGDIIIDENGDWYGDWGFDHDHGRGVVLKDGGIENVGPYWKTLVSGIINVPSIVAGTGLYKSRENEG